MKSILQSGASCKQRFFLVFVMIFMFQITRSNASPKNTVQRALHATTIHQFVYTDAPFEKVVRDIFSISSAKHPDLKGIRIVFHPQNSKADTNYDVLSTKLSIKMHDIPADTAFKYVLWQAGMRYDTRGRTLYIYKKTWLDVK